MAHDTANAYLRTKVMTASPAELRLMLIDGAIKFTRQGREGLAGRDFEACYSGFSQAKAILLELINCLRPEVDPDLCAKLSGLYTYMYRRLLDATLEKDSAIADEVIRLLEYERETWSMLMESLGSERPCGGEAALPDGSVRASGAGQPTGAASMHTPGGRQALSVEG
jgi:flagellar protein FliS